jgi:predicted metal-dependent hydrolase
MYLMFNDYTLKIRKNSRRVRLAVHQDGRVVVTASKSTKKSRIEAFISKQTEWIRSSFKRFEGMPKPVVPRGNRRDYTKYKEVARELVERRLEHFNAYSSYVFAIGRVSIRNQKTRWGSCSKKGNLNFSYRIALLPPELADYIVVHELCHLGEFNHSSNFWSLVEKAIPDYRERRRRLRS